MISAVLLDTSVASLLHPRKERRPELSLYEPEMRGKLLAVSFQTVAELWEWPERNNWGPTLKTGFAQFLARFVAIPYRSDLAQTWARVRAQTMRQGRLLGPADAWVAATALAYGLPLLTHDAHFLCVSIPGLVVKSYTPGR